MDWGKDKTGCCIRLLLECQIDVDPYIEYRFIWVLIKTSRK